MNQEEVRTGIHSCHACDRRASLGRSGRFRDLSRADYECVIISTLILKSRCAALDVANAWSPSITGTYARTFDSMPP